MMVVLKVKVYILVLIIFQKKILFVLKDKFNFKCSIHYKPRIYIFKESKDKLRSLVSQYFIK